MCVCVSLRFCALIKTTKQFLIFSSSSFFCLQLSYLAWGSTYWTFTGCITYLSYRQNITRRKCSHDRLLLVHVRVFCRLIWIFHLESFSSGQQQATLLTRMREQIFPTAQTPSLCALRRCYWTCGCGWVVVVVTSVYVCYVYAWVVWVGV